jgi:hypothetical protein
MFEIIAKIENPKQNGYWIFVNLNDEGIEQIGLIDEDDLKLLNVPEVCDLNHAIELFRKTRKSHIIDL